MKLWKRVRALEAQLVSAAVILYFPDGSMRDLRGRRHFIGGLLMAAHGGDVTVHEAAQLSLIRESVGAREMGGGHLIDLVRILLIARENGPPVGESEWDRCGGLSETTG